jgi:hypothetical protein
MSAQTSVPLRTNLRAHAKVRSLQCETGTSNNRSYITTPPSVTESGIREVEIETSAIRQARHRGGSRFLKGPIPWENIAVAAKLGGQGLAVYLAVHHRIALTRQPTTTLPRALLQQLGVSKDVKARALRQLELAGVIFVERVRGRSTRVGLADGHGSIGLQRP